ncbi:MAG: Glutamate-1-semialdehyde 2,1-aminomutase [Acidobacteria bacterium ADurb.Bin340]|nr:MAG: Glutamate-1-semialdehyde 2,1-aminomutase [Acidobacteria bacterium ADurb.Bin340]
MTNESLYQEALTHFPGGVSSPVRAFRSVGGTPKFFKRAWGARFEDEEGRTFVDLCMSWGPLILGHAHPEVVAAVQAAAAKGMSFGCPVVCSSTSSLPEVVGDAAELFDPANDAAIRYAIETVVSDMEKSQSLVKRGYERIKQFSWDKCARDTLDVYENVLGTNIR